MSVQQIQVELVAYEQALEHQLAEVRSLLVKGTKAGAKRVRKNSLELAAQAKELRKLTVANIG